jgi:hypothetical protein
MTSGYARGKDLATMGQRLVQGEMSRRKLAKMIDRLFFGLEVTKSVTPVATANLYTITGGSIQLVALYAIVTATIQTQANATKFVFTPTASGSASDLCATLDITAQAIGAYLAVSGGPTTALVSASRKYQQVSRATQHVVEPGVISLNCAASNTGAVVCYLFYTPVGEGATVVAA